ncbi:hypothetical protein H6P81_010783 [Aristolochia fimbriata]|uniref:Uncharacterized protein n=1 Tax=Aristolochia fimbriata TaxID=158543 RepID=A0AAV7EPR4_ARIFI|nr:hypothetical protein H6P81_010783 [Aristolochia fimbriata]
MKKNRPFPIPRRLSLFPCTTEPKSFSLSFFPLDSALKNVTAPPKISQLLPSQCIEEEPKPLPFSARLGRTDDQEIVRSRLPSLIVTFQCSPTSFSYDL